MSLLLDALKKAAKEKQQIDQAKESEIDSNVIESEMNADELELPVLDHPHEFLNNSSSMPEIEDIDKEVFEDLELDTSLIDVVEEQNADVSQDQHHASIMEDADEKKSAQVDIYPDEQSNNTVEDIPSESENTKKVIKQEEAPVYQGSENQAQQVFLSKENASGGLRVVLLILLLLLLVGGIAWWLYEQYFAVPAPVAQLNQYQKWPAQNLPLDNQPKIISKELEDPDIQDMQEDVVKTSSIKEPKPEVHVATRQAKKLNRSRPKKKAPESAVKPFAQERLSIIRVPKENHLQTQLSKGYEAYQRGDYGASRIAYSRALEEDKNNRDALLGLAANAMRKQRRDMAKHYYQRVLSLNPQDPAARSGLLELQEQQGGSTLAAIKNDIEQQPKSAPLYYSLGNQYVKQSNWGAAQAAYFQAFSLASDHPDYAFNLAISLDRMGKEAAALQYYQRAAQLAATKPHSIDLSALQQRVYYLENQRSNTHGANDG